MLARVQSTLPADINTVWGLLLQTRTLGFVAEGIMTYDGLADLPEVWEVGSNANLRPRLWGKAQGDHFVEVAEVDAEHHRIVTHEHGGVIKKWNHTMKLVEDYPGECHLIDTIDIGAGWQTPTIWLFAQHFYRYRHHRWQELIATTTK